jgi:transglutaminase-like putative cysteine protease
VGGATHAWCQVYLPGAGWVDFDPTSGVVGNRDLIRVAVARDPRQATPLTGTWYGRAEASLGMSVEVIVRRADETGTATDASGFNLRDGTGPLLA